MHLFRPVKHRNEITGTIYVASDLKELSDRLARYIGIVGVVFLASLLLAFALSSPLQRLASEPIMNSVQEPSVLWRRPSLVSGIFKRRQITPFELWK